VSVIACWFRRYGTPHHSRSQSVKTPGRSGNLASGNRPHLLCLPQQRARVASMPNTGVEEEYYRLRHFTITGKGVVNRGDSLKSKRSRSRTSVASSNSSHRYESLLKEALILGSCHKRQRRKRQSLTAKREKSQTPKVLTAIPTLPNLT